jgi:hypothetical protein
VIEAGPSFPSKRFHGSHNPCAANHGNCPIHPFYLLLYFGTMIKKHFVLSGGSKRVT